MDSTLLSQQTCKGQLSRPSTMTNNSPGLALVSFPDRSGLCGGATSMDALIVGRVMAGAGGTGSARAWSASLRDWSCLGIWSDSGTVCWRWVLRLVCNMGNGDSISTRSSMQLQVLSTCFTF
ncbi:hypothetical protein EMPG_14561 [Blastomyces silverae]|uniref:Uncharacterized protein n=1 Tax=Blastomyces silverae TaxID=2060906 RepID=A0A0H1BEX8_9EURO|nr:hypothetical protein EMPG_14561 [Blastomyces silverae]